MTLSTFEKIARIAALPVCISEQSIGEYPESEYDCFGEAAPVTWFCCCGGRLKSAHWAILPERGYYHRGEWQEDGDYVAVSADIKAQWFAEHASCEVAVQALAVELGVAPWEVACELRCQSEREAREEEARDKRRWAARDLAAARHQAALAAHAGLSVASSIGFQRFVNDRSRRLLGNK